MGGRAARTGLGPPPARARWLPPWRWRTGAGHPLQPRLRFLMRAALTLLSILLGIALGAPAASAGASASKVEAMLEEAAALNADGHYLLAARQLERAARAPGLQAAQRETLSYWSGRNANRMLRHRAAAEQLAPLAASAGPWQKGAALELAIARLGLGERAEARRLLQAVAGDGDPADATALQARLLLFRLADTPISPEAIDAWWATATRLSPAEGSPLALAALRLLLERGAADQTASRLLEAAREPPVIGRGRHTVELGEAESHLLELQGRYGEAIARARDTLRLADASRAAAEDLRYRLEWRAGRLLARQGDTDAALAAYQRAVASLEQLRIDLPITYPDGSSSHATALQPVYGALIDLLLKRAAAREGPQRQSDLLAARRISELLKQSELQDYLGERCAVTSKDAETLQKPDPGTALLYAIVLADRTEILIQVNDALESRRIDITADNLRILVQRFAATLRAGDEGFEAQADALSGLLLGDLPKHLASHNIDTLVVVPDGSLRLLPWAVLRTDGAYLGSRFAVATLSGLAIRGGTGGASGQSLVSGVSQPGPVVAKLRDLPALGSLAPA
ncbi:MAG: CHAT domain-containing protein, partial [Rhodocyclaceae bacterium]|nr:CHAT domain-containing protein [Rhodocyclaceae bacterium]